MGGISYLSCRADSAILICDSHPQASTSQSLSYSNNNNKNSKHSKKKKTNNRTNHVNGASQFIQEPTIQQFNYRDLQAATDNFSSHHLLGRGSHGSVYKAVLRSGRLVAVKKPPVLCNSYPNSNSNSSSNSNSFVSATEVDNEIEILSKLRSPRLVNLVGVSSASSPSPSPNSSNSRLLVVEFMSNGTLYDVLHSSPRPPAWSRRLRLALQTALAVDTLHSSSPPVIHRDIKSANILIDRNFNARLGDFGLALRCHADDFRLRSTPPAGTLGYLDPCYVTPDNLSTKTDVFSFGILLLEIISGRKAIDVGFSPPSIVDWAVPLARKGKVLAVFDPRIPPPKDPSARKQLVMLAMRCVRSSRERRPNMKEIVEELKILSKSIPGNLWDNLTVNPCMMVDEVGHAIGTRRPHSSSEVRQIDSSAKPGRVSRNTSRVFSDSGSSSRNLKELLAGTERESDSGGSSIGSLTSVVRGFRVASGRSFGSTRSQPIGHDYDSDGILRLRLNES